MHSKRDPKSNLYKQAGVDIEKGDAMVDWLRQDERARPSSEAFKPLGEVVEGIGGFAALYRPDFKSMLDPLLISSTDGVGTKVLLGLDTGRLQGLGCDLVAMCVNDLYTVGGRPLFFLDYYATGTLQEDQFKYILTGIKNGCSQCGAALMGGETAELPGLYAKDHFDLAGFVVGVVDGSKRLGAHRVKIGDRLIALASSGFHSNGYSLIRKWLSDMKEQASIELLDHLMEPTRIYSEIPEILSGLPDNAVHALSHITGGGISGNLVRVLPEGVQAIVHKKSLKTPEWMREFIEKNTEDKFDVESVFNLGAGMIACVSPEHAQAFLKGAKLSGLDASEIGEVQKSASSKTQVTLI